jgi:hypothetical protein
MRRGDPDARLGPEIEDYTLQANKIRVECLQSPYMKIMAGRFVGAGLALLVMIASTASCLGDPETDKTNPPVKTTASKAKDTVKDAVAEGKDAVRQGVQKADEAVTNVVHQIGVGVHKATGVATNVAAKVKVAVTNAVGEATEAVKDATR